MTATNVTTVTRSAYVIAGAESLRGPTSDGQLLGVAVEPTLPCQPSLSLVPSICLCQQARVDWGDDRGGSDGRMHIFSALDFSAPTTRLMSWLARGASD